MKSRTRARSVALQALYEIDIADHLPGDVLQQRLEEESPSRRAGGVRRARSSLACCHWPTNLDHIIARYAPEWPLDQIAAIDRNILRVACWELAVQRETPLKVAINEAVELAKLYGSDSAPRFVNGVLGSLADHQNEIAQQLRNAVLELEASPVVSPTKAD